LEKIITNQLPKITPITLYIFPKTSGMTSHTFHTSIPSQHPQKNPPQLSEK